MITVVCYEFVVDGKSEGLKEMRYLNPYEAIIASISLISNSINFTVRYEEPVQ